MFTNIDDTKVHDNNDGWIGVDLDGTLAQYTSFVDLYHIGEPIPLMVEQVQRWLAAGKTVKIFTARVSCPSDHYQKVLSTIQAWCVQHIGIALEVTNIKDLHMDELWDDRAVQVIKNTGTIAGFSTRGFDKI